LQVVEEGLLVEVRTVSQELVLLDVAVVAHVQRLEEFDLVHLVPGYFELLEDQVEFVEVELAVVVLVELEEDLVEIINVLGFSLLADRPPQHLLHRAHVVAVVHALDKCVPVGISELELLLALLLQVEPTAFDALDWIGPVGRILVQQGQHQTFAVPADVPQLFVTEVYVLGLLHILLLGVVDC